MAKLYIEQNIRILKTFKFHFLDLDVFRYTEHDFTMFWKTSLNLYSSDMYVIQTFEALYMSRTN